MSTFGANTDSGGISLVPVLCSVLCQGVIAIVLYVAKSGDTEPDWLAFPCSTGHAFDVADTTGPDIADDVQRIMILCKQDTVLSTAEQIVYDCGDCTHSQWLYLAGCAVLWGIGDAVWNTQISAVIGGTFTETKEDAFANLKVRFADGHLRLLLYAWQLC